MRHFYTLDPSDHRPQKDWRASIPTGYTVRRVTPELLADPDIEAGSLRDELDKMWAALDRFFDSDPVRFEEGW